MIGWQEVYNVAATTVPLYIPLALGYGSVRWWHMFKATQCDSINRLSCYFILPFFNFDFVAHVNPYQMNYRFMAADIISKCIIGVALIFWANLCPKGSFSWAITSFSLSTLNSTLVMGVPVLKGMYGLMGADLAVQSYVIQSIFWYPALLFMFELWCLKIKVSSEMINVSSEMGPIRDLHVNSVEEIKINLEENTSRHVEVNQTVSFWSLMKIVPIKVLRNPNCFSCILGLVWALLANRWNFQMPSIVEGSITIMSKAGSGIAMFTLGLFMALQDKVIACGHKLTFFGMFLRFIMGPATLAIGSLIVRLRGDVFNAVVIQAALPLSIPAFVFAKEYELHANIISTSVIFGTIVSLPVVIAYFAIMETLN